jgi:uncharacterized membrane protein (DUF4010 family)
LPLPPFDPSSLWNLAVALIGGLSVGIERQWSGHAQGDRARFAGIRTFSLLGLVSGLSGWLWTLGITGPAVIFLAGLAALVVVAYFSASRADVDGTTEVAAFVVMAAGTLAGIGYIRLASGVMALTTLLLIEKTRLHRWVRMLDRSEVRAGARFAVMAVVILPLLPEGPFGPADTIRPRLLWALVLFFSGLSFVGYVAQRMLGRSRGYMLTGTLGGMLSSTSVTLTFSRLSRDGRDAEEGRALAAGTLGANAVLFPRVLVATALLAPALTLALWPLLVVPCVIGLLLALRGLRGGAETERRAHHENPLQFGSAIQMAALFQVVLFGVAIATHYFGERGVYVSSAVLGLADMDALTISMAGLANKGTPVHVAAVAVCIGIIANTCVKLGITLAIGRGRFRVLTAAGLTAIGVALAGALWLSTSGAGHLDSVRRYFFGG